MNSSTRQFVNVPIYVDQLGKQIRLPSPPRRIVSLVPSQTELLFDLGMDTEVVGITKFCVHPDEWFRSKVRVGGTKTPDIEKILSLQPDLLIANKEENKKEDIEEIEKFCPVWTSVINNRFDATDMIKSIGAITGKSEKAYLISERINKQFDALKPIRNYRCAYLIWKDPWMVAGGETFIHDMLASCGFINVFGNTERYPEISLQDLARNKTEILLLSSEPYPFKKNHLDELSDILHEMKIMLVEGEFFSWYGSRMKHASGYFQELIAGLERYKK